MNTARRICIAVGIMSCAARPYTREGVIRSVFAVAQSIVVVVAVVVAGVFVKEASSWIRGKAAVNVLPWTDSAEWRQTLRTKFPFSALSA
jgi:cell division protein FtsW (lipid II flippase)